MSKYLYVTRWSKYIVHYNLYYLDCKTELIKFNIQILDISVTKERNAYFRNAISKITFDIAKI